MKPLSIVFSTTLCMFLLLFSSRAKAQDDDAVPIAQDDAPQLVATNQQPPPVDEAFYNSLAEYGQWLSVPVYGQVWKPYGVDPSWRPYIRGHWVWTSYGWYWASDEPFGWATYHYGRWIYNDGDGWLWIPGRVWSPAWVEWRTSEDYIGWAPLGPSVRFSVEVGLTYESDWMTPVTYYNFVPCRRFTSHKIVTYVEPADRIRSIYWGTTVHRDIHVEGGHVVNHGITREFVEGRTKERIHLVSISGRSEKRESLARVKGPEHLQIHTINSSQHISTGVPSSKPEHKYSDVPGRLNALQGSAKKDRPEAHQPQNRIGNGVVAQSLKVQLQNRTSSGNLSQSPKAQPKDRTGNVVIPQRPKTKPQNDREKKKDEQTNHR